MANEREVRERDRESLLGSWFGGFVHGEQRYYASVYGAPGEGAPWGLRFDGHHVSLNWTVPRAGAVSVTPLFLGGEPREVPADQRARGSARARRGGGPRLRALERAAPRAARSAAQIEFEPASGIAAMNRPLFLGEGPQVARARAARDRARRPRPGAAGGARRARRDLLRELQRRDRGRAPRRDRRGRPRRDPLRVGGQPAAAASRATTACRDRPS